MACAVLALMATSAFADVVIYATERENNQIVQVNLTTNAITVVRNTFPGSPDSMVLDSQGRIIYDLADTNQLRRFDPAGAPATCTIPNGACPSDVLLADATNGISAPQDIVLDPGGASVLVSNFLGGTITRTNLTTLVTTVLANIQTPEGIAYDNTGRLFVLFAFGTAGDGIAQLNPTTGAIIQS